MRTLGWAALLGGGLLATACASTPETTPTAPPPTASATVAPDTTGPAARGYALMTGGTEGGALLVGGFACPSCDPTFSGFGDMWAFDPAGTWTDLSPDTIPPGADDFAFDSQSQRAVLVEIVGATWSYAPSTNVWESLEVADRPIGLHGSKMVYDEGSDRMIVFSGDNFSPGSMHDETWAFDLDTGTWERMTPRKSPPMRTYYAMAYDASSDRTILFGGGGTTTGDPRGDTWAYDYDTDMWVQMDPKRSPPARVYSSAAYDAASDRVIMYGGSVDEETAVFQDTWAYDYDTDTWTELSADAPIGPLAWHAMAPLDAGIVLFGGGVTREEYVADTWKFEVDEATWSPA